MTGTLIETIGSLRLNEAVYELLLDVGTGDVDPTHLADMINKAIELNGQALERLDKLVEAVPDVDVTLRNAVKPEYSEEHGEWLIWCGQEQDAQNLIDTTKLLHEAVRKQDD